MYFIFILLQIHHGNIVDSADGEKLKHSLLEIVRNSAPVELYQEEFIFNFHLNV